MSTRRDASAQFIRKYYNPKFRHFKVIEDHHISPYETQLDIAYNVISLPFDTIQYRQNPRNLNKCHFPGTFPKFCELFLQVFERNYAL